MESIRKLCIAGIVLKSGNLIIKTDIDKSIQTYLRSVDLSDATMIFKNDETKLAQFKSIKLSNMNGLIGNKYHQNEKICIELSVIFKENLHSCMTAISIISEQGVPIFTTTDWDFDPTDRFFKREKGITNYKIIIPNNFLFPGRYFIRLGLGISGHHKYDQVPYSINFEIDHEGSIMSELSDQRIGVITPIIEWFNN